MQATETLGGKNTSPESIRWLPGGFNIFIDVFREGVCVPSQVVLLIIQGNTRPSISRLPLPRGRYQADQAGNDVPCQIQGEPGHGG